MTTIYHNDTATTAADLITNNADDPQVVRAVLDLMEGNQTTVEMGGGGAPLTVLSLYPDPPPCDGINRAKACNSWVTHLFDAWFVLASTSKDRVFMSYIDGRSGADLVRFDNWPGRPASNTGRIAIVEACPEIWAEYTVSLFDSWDAMHRCGDDVRTFISTELCSPAEVVELCTAWIHEDDERVEAMTGPPRFVYEIEAVMSCNVTVRIEGPLTEKEARDAVEEHLWGGGSGSSAEFETHYIDEDAGIEAEVIDVEVWQGVQDMDTISAEEV